MQESRPREAAPIFAFLDVWRKDIYEKNVKQYYVESFTGVKYEEGWDESFEQRYSGNANASAAIMRGVDGPGPGFSNREALEDEGEGEESETDSAGSEDDDHDKEEVASDAGRSQKSMKRPRREVAQEEKYEEELRRNMFDVYTIGLRMS